MHAQTTSRTDLLDSVSIHISWSSQGREQSPPGPWIKNRHTVIIEGGVQGRSCSKEGGEDIHGLPLSILVRHAASTVQAQTLASSTVSEGVGRKLQ